MDNENETAVQDVEVQVVRLTTEQRRIARKKAQDEIVAKLGRRPQWHDYKSNSVSRFPRWLTWGVAAMLFLVFAAAANVSVYRVFTAGRDHFLETIHVEWQAAIVGISAFLMAEFMVIAATIARRVYFKDDAGQRVMVIPITLGLIMAFVGNWAVTNPIFDWTAAGVWAIAETAIPPAAVLFMALIGEQLALSEIETRHANRQQYEAALLDWDRRADEVELHPEWRGTWAAVLWDTLLKVNGSGVGKTKRLEFLHGLSRADRSRIVYREMVADQWFMAEAVEMVESAEGEGENPTTPQSDGKLLSPDGRGMHLRPQTAMAYQDNNKIS